MEKMLALKTIAHNFANFKVHMIQGEEGIIERLLFAVSPHTVVAKKSLLKVNFSDTNFQGFKRIKEIKHTLFPHIKIELG